MRLLRSPQTLKSLSECRLPTTAAPSNSTAAATTSTGSQESPTTPNPTFKFSTTAITTKEKLCFCPNLTHSFPTPTKSAPLSSMRLRWNSPH
ncbi:hypothetical protein L596_006227 [Steinernema carpocapsae]|uniref:Uncharacterized protein n=1 Tax=Steinernema carpocapsae TaxID=34508 RepID=A0A4U8V1F8_STECR|nr:hypothetical protein L596_006227 [Steinernema carpocapsae]